MKKVGRFFAGVSLFILTNVTLQISLINPVNSQKTKAFLWELKSEKNTLYILGSIHLLRQTDYPLPNVIQQAYDDAEHLVFEADIGEQNTQQLMIQKALPDTPNESLLKALDAQTYESVKNKATQMGLPMEMFDRFEPWFFSITLSSIQILKLGYSPVYGIDRYLYSKALPTSKKISALESVEEQLDFFDKLSIPTQNDLVKQSIQNSDSLSSDLDIIVNSWKTGNVQKLEEVLLDGFKKYPEIERVLLTKRNKTWVKQIEPLINQSEDDYLIVVGSAHLLGDEGLIELMQNKGYQLQQL